MTSFGAKLTSFGQKNSSVQTWFSIFVIQKFDKDNEDNDDGGLDDGDEEKDNNYDDD